MAIKKTVVVSLEIVDAPDIVLVVTPLALKTAIGTITAYTAQVTSLNSFAGEVTFSIEGLPAGVTAQFFPSTKIMLDPSSPKGVQINLTIPNDKTLIKTYSLPINAEAA